MTTNIAPITSGAPSVARALRDASARTGVGFDVLYNIARRESDFNPDAKAKTSSAAGLFQFIEQTWLGAVKDYGAKHGLAAEAAAITRGADGRLSVEDPAARKKILDLRFDADKAAALAGELLQSNAEQLQQRLGRAVENVELYAAHFLGVSGAVKLLQAPSDANAADLLPAAARANRGVFFNGGAPKTVGEVVASIAQSLNASVPEPSTPLREGVSLGELRWSNLLSDGPRSPFDALGAQANILSPFSLSVLQALDPTRVKDRKRDSVV